jgi:hypothetical protein
MLGEGPATIGQAGCLLCCYVEAMGLLRDLPTTPPMLNKAIRDKRGFLHSMLIQPVAAEVAGLKVTEKVVGDATALRGVIGDALRAGKALVAHVDHTGDAFGDHFVLIHSEHVDASGNKRLIYADPATGRDAELDAVDLKGATVWGTRPKVYRVRSVRAVSA